MWLNLDREQVDRIIVKLRSTNDRGLYNDKDIQLADGLEATMKDRFDPAGQAWVEKAFELHQDEGTLEVDQQSDGSSVVAYSDDGGAYLMAWVWVSNKAMGIASDDDEDDDGTCETCGEEYEDGGDGYDGHCPDCADIKERIDNPEEHYSRSDWEDAEVSGNTTLPYEAWVETQLNNDRLALAERRDSKKEGA